MNKQNRVIWISFMENEPASDEGGDVLFLVNTWLVILFVLTFLFVAFGLGVNPLPLFFGILNAMHGR